MENLKGVWYNRFDKKYRGVYTEEYNELDSMCGVSEKEPDKRTG